MSNPIMSLCTANKPIQLITCCMVLVVSFLIMTCSSIKAQQGDPQKIKKPTARRLFANRLEFKTEKEAKLIVKQDQWDDLPIVGEVRIMPFNFAPRGWAFCDGQLLPIIGNEALFKELGTQYGGDGRTTFALPDLRGRTAVHIGRISNGVVVKAGQKLGGVVASPAKDGEKTVVPPGLDLNYVIALVGLDPQKIKAGDADAYPGEVRLFAGTTNPKGWLPCDGQRLEIAKNKKLHQQLGDTFGEEMDGKFSIPDLRGKILLHNSTARDGIKQGDLIKPTKAVRDKPTDKTRETQARLGIKHMISLQGSKRPGVQSLVGEIRIIPGVSLPKNWSRCDGQSISIPSNTALFALLGTTFGGNGRTTFHLPDLQGRSAVHNGRGEGLTKVKLGQATKGANPNSALSDVKPSQIMETAPCIGIRFAIGTGGIFPSRY